MKPIIILPPDMMSDDNINQLRENGICVVIAKDPAKVRFLDPIPSVSSRTQMEDAAIRLSRRLLAGDLFQSSRRDFANLYVDCLIKGTSLDANYVEPREESKAQKATGKNRAK